MKLKHFLLGILGLLQFAARATDAIYENDATAVTPTVDAVSFINNGTLDILGINFPFTTQNTLYYTNRGTINGSIDFEYINGDTGMEAWASVIDNDNGAQILPPLGGAAIGPYHFLKATNIINRGTITTPYTGLIRLEGGNVDLRYGALEVAGLVGQGTAIIPNTTNFIQEIGVQDGYWGGGTFAVDPSKILTAQGRRYIAKSPSYTVTNSSGFIQTLQQSFLGPQIFALTNAIGASGTNTATNQIFQIVFIDNGNTNVSVGVSFKPSLDLSNPFRKIFVTLSSKSTNPVSRFVETDQIQISDASTSTTNLALLSPLPADGTYQPAPFLYDRSVPPLDSGIMGANFAISPTNFLKWFDTTFTNGMKFTNAIISNAFYLASGVIVSSQAPSVASYSPLTGVTDVPGRIEIDSDTLNLDRARFRSQAVVNIKTKDLKSSVGTVIDAPILNYTLGSKSGLLTVENLAAPTARRFADGTLEVMSMVFTNGFANFVTNSMDTNNITVTETDYAAYFHVLYVKARLTVDQQASVNGMVLDSTNTVFNDTANLLNQFEVTGTSFTLNGALTLGTAVNNPGLNGWYASNAPSVINFTNNGTLICPNGQQFGTDRPTPYNNWVNTGTNLATSILVKTTNLLDTGVLYTYNSGSIQLQANALKVDGGSFTSAGDIGLTGGSLKVRNGILNASGGLYLNFTDSVSDAGLSGGSQFYAAYNIGANVKPATGDLLGSTFNIAVPQYRSGSIVWAGNDVGPNRAGFVNNLAIAELNIAVGDQGTLSFSGATGTNAIYVDRLILSPAITNDLASFIAVDPNFTIYFADANVPVDQINGALGGRLQWVSNFAGPLSGVPVALSDGTVIRVNINLLNSLTVDSNGNGIVNGLDPAPFDAPHLSVSSTTNGVPVLSWNGGGQTVYEIDYRTNLFKGAWSPLANVTNTASLAAPLKYTDSTAGKVPHFYRISYTP
jgi:hypothetical protein